MKPIEKYLDFAVRNWYEYIGMFDRVKGMVQLERLYYIWTISSYDFIEAVAKWLLPDVVEEWVDLNQLIARITVMQATAIRDGKLDDYINSLLPDIKK